MARRAARVVVKCRRSSRSSSRRRRFATVRDARDGEHARGVVRERADGDAHVPHADVRRHRGLRARGASTEALDWIRRRATKIRFARRRGRRARTAGD